MLHDFKTIRDGVEALPLNSVECGFSLPLRRSDHSVQICTELTPPAPARNLVRRLLPNPLGWVILHRGALVPNHCGSPMGLATPHCERW
jgi:hypothetical protein